MSQGLLATEAALEVLNSKLDNEYLKLKIKYQEEDSLFFVDLLDIMLSIKMDDSLSDSSKILYFNQLYFFLKDANTDLFAKKKIEDLSYRRAIRFFPSIIYYNEKNKLHEFALYYPEEILNAITLVPNENIVKNILISLGIENPRWIYNNLEELHTFAYIDKIVELLIIMDPATFVYQYDMNPYLQNFANGSENMVIKEIMKIKQSFGNGSSLYNYINDIVKNGFNDTKEIDFMAYKMNYTKILLRIAQDEMAFGRYSAINYLSKSGKWLFEEYIENGNSAFADFNSDELFLLTVMCVEMLEKDDIANILAYIRNGKEDGVNLKMLQSIPSKKLTRFYEIVEKIKLTQPLYSALDISATSFILEKVKYKKENTPTLKNQHWLATRFNPEADRREREFRISKQIEQTFSINKTQFALLSWTRNLNKVDSNFSGIMKSAIGQPFLNYVCHYQPQVVFNNKDVLKNRTDFGSIIGKIAYAAPNSIKKYLSNPENDIYRTLNTQPNEASKILFSIYEKYKFNTKAYTLLDKILRKEMTLEDAHLVGNSQIDYVQKLCQISISKNAFGMHSVESDQNELSLILIRQINDNATPQNPTLVKIKQYTGKELYSFMILGREELFDFTFNQFYGSMMSQLGNFDLMLFFESVNYYRFREFCNLLAEFDKFSPFFDYHTTSEIDRHKFMEKFVHIDFADIHALEHAAAISEFIAKCNDPKIQTLLQLKIKRAYDQAVTRKDQLAMAVYSLLASNIGKRATEHREWFVEMEQKFAQHSYTSIKVDELKNNKKKIIETCYFYNDADGVASYTSFINTFKLMPNWMIQDLGSYVYISSLQGVEIEIFANKPQFEVTGQAAIAEYMTVNQLEPSIIIHRGHSYHSQKTINQMIGSPKFIFMGSCGGYYKIPELLERSPNAQILSTKQVGTMHINDPAFKQINEILRSNQNLDWVNFWETQKERLGKNKDFKDYVPPHKNNGALFINAFFKVVGTL
jgi:hypothetical protein